MCGRFALHAPPKRIQEQFGIANPMAHKPRYNIAPSQEVPVVRVTEDARLLVLARWGLVPSWTKEPEKLPRPINAKAETAATKPMFRQAYRRSRILVPADCFYEWQTRAGRKQPYLIHMRDGAPFGMGGLLEHWGMPEADMLTFTILTTSANELMAGIHDRMPVIIKPEHYSAWLDPQLTDTAKIQPLIKPYPSDSMEAYPISTRVNSPKSEGPEILGRVALD